MKRKLNEYEDDCYEEKRICIYYKKVFLIASEPVLCPLCCDLIKNEATTSCNHNFCMYCLSNVFLLFI